MIRSITLKHFKCLREATLSSSQLNLLCGLNGTGKSSVIQSLLVLKQSHNAGYLADGRLLLAGDLADLGTGRDVMYDGDVPDTLGISLKSDRINETLVMNFAYSASSNELVAESSSSAPFEMIPESWSSEQPFYGRFLYVTAEREGPRKLYPKSERHGRLRELGQQGEYAWNILATEGGTELPEDDSRCLDSSDRRLLSTVNSWLQHVSPGCILELDSDSASAADVIIPGIRFRQHGDVPTRPYRPTNVGFGLSYTLSVILALLSEAGTLCFIENPEAHLHPRGQTKLGELAARAAKAGVQIFVETHSDHFMDGVRIAVREGIIEPEDVKFHYFQREGNTATVTTPEIDKDGRLSEWPPGFFDQADFNLDRLLAPKDWD